MRYHANLAVTRHLRSAFRGEATDPDYIPRGQPVQRARQRGIAYLEQRLSFRARKFVRRAISAARLEKGQRAIVQHKITREECVRRAIPLLCPPPQSLTANLTARAIESQHRPRGMVRPWLVHRANDAEPVAHHARITERDAGLHHAPGPRIHACLLYTSDAADDLLCVDLGGRRI